MRTCLVTGGAGFIGSHFILHQLAHRRDQKIINIDALTYAANPAYLSSVAQHPHYQFIQGNICDARLVQDIFSAHDIQTIVHFAAESHVDNSILSPDNFVRSNVIGTTVLLEAAKHAWLGSTPKPNGCFFHVSTDEVYGEISEGFFTESSPYQPNSPYSASKAASDFFVRAYQKTYGLPTCITHCSNNFGPHQHDEKLIPTIIRHALAHKPIPIYGTGQNVRDWLFVQDHVRAIDAILHAGHTDTQYMIGAKHLWSNLDLATYICRYLNKTHAHNIDYTSLITLVADRPGHDVRYAIDAAALEHALDWRPLHDFESAMHATIDWYVQRYQATIKEYTT